MKNKNHILIVTFSFCLISLSYAQLPFVKLTEPLKESNKVSGAKQFIIGSTCKSCLLTINGQAVKVYPTGAFAFSLNLKAGDTTFMITSTNTGAKPVLKRVDFSFTIPPPATSVTTFTIESIQTFPEDDLVLKPGDKIRFKVKALPGAGLSTINDTRLYELPLSQSQGISGIYQGEYMVKITDTFKSFHFPLILTNSNGEKVIKETRNIFSVMTPTDNDIALTMGRLAHLEYGLGDDRLGGAKVGYIDSLIPLQIIGKAGTHYKVMLAPSRTAYVPEDVVTVMPKGSIAGKSLTGKWIVSGDEQYDYVTIALSARLPYQSMQLINPSRIIVDIFGATSNTNWITQLGSAKEIENVDYEQVADEIFRISIQLKHRQHWGHQVYYKGNSLVIKIKHQPVDLSLKSLTIGIDAGHGGTNTGAGGPTGVAEKTLALAIALKLKTMLLAESARVIMTRDADQFVDNKERILFYRDSLPDLLISVHLNSSADPFQSEGTSTFYRYIGFRPLSFAIHKRMLELNLKDNGNNGSFNFMLNSPTEYPNALVETLFLSNPEEEMKVLDEKFQEKIALKILQGIKDFLQESKG